MIIALAWSGGLDSLGGLYALLRDTTHEIHAHHVVMRNNDKRADAELRAIEAQLAWFRRSSLRAFAYSQSVIDFSSVWFVPTDADVIAFAMAQIMKHHRPRIDRLCIGHCAEDSARLRARGWLRNPAWQPAYLAIEALTQTPAAEFYYRSPCFAMNKAEIRAMIGDELADLAWGCRRPIDGVRPCGECYTCRDLGLAAPATVVAR